MDTPKNLPRIFLIGDSIRMGYAPLVIDALKDQALVFQPPENCDGTKKILKRLKKWLNPVDGKTLNLIHFNSGHHDTKRPNVKKQSFISKTKYAKNLHKLLEKFSTYSPSAKLIFLKISR